MNLFHHKLAILVIFFSMMAVGPSYAATFTVNDMVSDTVDINPGDNVCIDAFAKCTLRAAIMEANALAGGDIIIVPNGTYTLTIGGTAEDAAATGDLDITGDLSINGNGAGITVINGGALDRVFHITGAFTVVLSNMTIQNGSINDNGGGIYSSGSVTLDAVTLNNNRTTIQDGGGIYSNGSSVTIRNGSVISNNTASAYGGGVDMLSAGSVTITDSTFTGNSSGAGGGGVGCRTCSTLNITDSLFTNNSAGSIGGGIYGDNGTSNISGTTFDASAGANRATTDGGCIWIGNLLTLTNVTMKGCTAGDQGGGLFVDDATTTISNSLIKGNTAGGAGKGGGIYANTGTAIVDTTYVIYNNTEDCVDGGGGITDNGGNFDSDGTCSTFARYVPPSFSTYTLTVYATGAAPAGMGRVYSDPAGIDCPGTCSATFDDGTEITLYTQNRNGMEFFRWEGACSSFQRSDPCVLTVNEYKEVPVRFYPPATQDSSDSGSGTLLVSPLNGSAGVPTTYPFIWSNLTDPDGNPITYDLLFCDGFESGNCTSWSASSRLAGQNTDRMFAGFGALSGIVLFGFLLGGGMRTRGGRAFMFTLFFVTAGFTITACSSSDSDSFVSDSGQSTGDETVALTCDSVEEGQQCLLVTGMTPNTNYYWKVAASDGNGANLDSDVWSFTTGD